MMHEGINRVLYLVTCVRVKISPLIKRLKRSYQEYSGIKGLIFNFLFHTSFLYSLIFINSRVLYFYRIRKTCLRVLNFAILKISKKINFVIFHFVKGSLPFPGSV